MKNTIVGSTAPAYHNNTSHGLLPRLSRPSTSPSTLGQTRLARLPEPQYSPTTSRWSPLSSHHNVPALEHLSNNHNQNRTAANANDSLAYNNKVSSNRSLQSFSSVVEGPNHFSSVVAGHEHVFPLTDSTLPVSHLAPPVYHCQYQVPYSSSWIYPTPTSMEYLTEQGLAAYSPLLVQLGELTAKEEPLEYQTAFQMDLSTRSSSEDSESLAPSPLPELEADHVSPYVSFVWPQDAPSSPFVLEQRLSSADQTSSELPASTQVNGDDDAQAWTVSPFELSIAAPTLPPVAEDEAEEQEDAQPTTPVEPRGRKRKAPTGTRHTSAPLLDIGEPVKARSYVLPSRTSRKIIPKAMQKAARKSRASSVMSSNESLSGSLDLDEYDLSVVEAKRLKNTEAARKSRLRKKETLDSLNATIDDLQAQLRQQIERTHKWQREAERCRALLGLDPKFL
ncbi:uncharacterized protein L969DRAFT_96662 [Mixia osmundae IAM 14324]|uniref:BZIP domain-containing protein n=1 Tax=Mixia osmundae (strain CBS 9802 / IAM 14324 / JCM 22182 / KY 12970) TaxID=764103 RepID=G7DSY4_MIXOS|nr:uncharacterized protein L969DRAFT_96662 [Mixia osmundae IAM 14324]KEI37089.1 hypothetical protein L969DRAFT_96662 [Mixia osmundae IAM 14324]GAA93694.1 hypothetical protein E5Q_00339 [Mixia osmundae IAM 14324]